METSEPTPEYQEKIERAEKIMWEVEKMIRARRVGIPTLHQFISQIDADTLQIFFIWSEQLAEYGEDIAYGKGWGLNDYEDEEKNEIKIC